MSKKSAGFTLVELVVGIVVLAIAMMVMNTFLISQSSNALEPIYRLRASQLGQSVIQNIMSRSFDENSDHNGGTYRCGEAWHNGEFWYDGTSWTSSEVTISCTDESKFGPDDGESKGDNYDDVDDFNFSDESEFVNAVEYGDLLGADFPDDFQNYFVNVAVTYQTLASVEMKKIVVTVKTPTDEEIEFSAVKGNY